MALETLDRKRFADGGAVDDTTPPAPADPVAPIPAGATGASSLSSPLTALSDYNNAVKSFGQDLSPQAQNQRMWLAYAKGAMTPGNFGASAEGALSSLTDAQSKEQALKERYIPIIEGAMQKQVQIQQGMRAQDIALGNAALGSLAPMLNSSTPLTKQTAGQVLMAAVQTGRTDMAHAQNLFQTLPDDPDDLRRQLTGQVQSAVDPFNQHLTKLSPGQAAINPLTGQTVASVKKYNVETIDQGNQKVVVATNASDPTDRQVLGTYAAGTSPDAELRAKTDRYTAQLQASTSAANNAANIKKDLTIAGMNPDGSPNAGFDSIVDMLGKYQASPNQMLSRFPPGVRANITAQIAQKYPNWDATFYDAKDAAAKTFTGGPLGGAMRSIAVANNHLSMLNDLVDNLHNKQIPAANAIGNAIATQFGWTGKTDFDAVRGIVGQEVTKAIVPGGGTEGERDEAKAAFDAAKTPDQLKSVIQKYRMVMQAQYNGLHAQRQAAGLPDSTMPKYDETPPAASPKPAGPVVPTAAASAVATATPSANGFSYVGVAPQPGVQQ